MHSLTMDIDSHKLMYHPERVSEWLNAGDDWEKSQHVKPLYVEVSPSAKCNHRCHFCAYDYTEFKGPFLDHKIMKSRFLEMAEQGVKSVMLAGEGEPLLHPHSAELITDALDAKLEIGITTNGSLLTKEKVGNNLQRLSWIKISCNGGDAKSYAKVHQANEQEFEKVISNVKKTIAEVKRIGSQCKIGLQMVLLKDNQDSILNLGRIAKDIGAHYLVIKPYNQYSLSNNQLDYIGLSGLSQQIESLKELEDDHFKVICRENSFKQNEQSTRVSQKCSAVPNFWGYIKSTGEMIGCYVHIEKEEMAWGNILKQSYQDILFSEKRKSCSEFVGNKLDISECSKQCRMSSINDYLWRIKHPQEHDNFI